MPGQYIATVHSYSLLKTFQADMLDLYADAFDTIMYIQERDAEDVVTLPEEKRKSIWTLLEAKVIHLKFDL